MLKYLECLSLPWTAPACTGFWVWVIAACFLFALACGFAVLFSLYQYEKKLAAALRAQAQRDAVNYEAIADLKAPWDGDPAAADRWKGNQ